MQVDEWNVKTTLILCERSVRGRTTPATVKMVERRFSRHRCVPGGRYLKNSRHVQGDCDQCGNENQLN